MSDQPELKSSYEGAEVEELLPHRKPFLFVDRLTSVDKQRVVGEVTYRPDMWFFAGHFPKYPVVPGVIITETMAQCGGAGLVATGLVPKGGIFLLVGVDNAKFRRQVRPGDEVRCEITNLRVSQKMIKQSGIAYVGDEVAAEAEWMCLVGNS